MPSWKKLITSGSSAHLNQVTASSGIQLADNAKLNLGDANDLQISHDGSNSFIKDAGTGNIFYRSGTQTFQNAAGSKTMLTLNAANSVDLNYNNNTKLQTTNIGVSVTGNIVASTHVTASGNISGSLTSTGSFGSLIVADKVRGTLTVGSTLTSQGNLQVRKSFPDIILRANNEQRLNFSDDGNSIQSGIKNNSGTMKFYGNNSANTIRLTLNDTVAEFAGNVVASGYITGSYISASNDIYAAGNLRIIGNISGSSISSSGDILADGDVVAYNSSDERLKDNIEVIQGSLDKIGEIRGVEFDWNDKSPGWAQERGHDVGVVAQEVQKVIPEIVVERKNGYLGVDYKRIVPLLIESVKDLKKQIENLNEEVKELKNK